MRFSSSLLLLLFVCASECGSAQVVDLGRDRVAMAELAGPWRFHTGDDPAWANPGFDDAAWTLVRADEGWSRQGYQGVSGVAWYRLKILLPQRHGPLALYIPGVEVSCQVFANGRPIGQIGGLPPQPKYIAQSRTVIRIPDDLPQGGVLTIAIRAWLDPRLDGSMAGGLSAAPRIGDTEAIAQWRKLAGREIYWRNSASIVELFANLLGALACLSVFLLRRKEREYLWFGLYLLNWSIFHVAALYAAFRPVPYYGFSLSICLLLGLGPYTGAEYTVALARQRRGWLYAGAAFFAIAAAGATALDRFQPQHLWNLVHVAGLTVYWVCLAAILVRAWKSGTRDTAILLIPVAWGLAEAVLFVLAYSPAFQHQAWVQAYLGFMNSGTRWPFPYFVPSLAGDLSNVVVLIVLIRRYAHSRRDEERLGSELESARIVQRAQIPDEVPAIPGYEIQAVYKPASHVGGDFFQIIPLDGGGALVAIGDVSGKGMPAALTVSLLVGTLRTLAHYTQSPGEILSAMNQRMIARNTGGFATCLVLRIDPEGALTLASAGHLPPYRNSEEIAAQPALPLGIWPESAYAETPLTLSPGSRLTLLTDGVVEARNAAGELFGFERVAALCREPAAKITQAAQAFGQEDDITVLTLTLQAA